MNEKYLNMRLPPAEFDRLERYAWWTGRTKTDIVRDLIRTLTLPSSARSPSADAPRALAGRPRPRG